MHVTGTHNALAADGNRREPPQFDIRIRPLLLSYDTPTRLVCEARLVSYTGELCSWDPRERRTKFHRFNKFPLGRSCLDCKVSPVSANWFLPFVRRYFYRRFTVHLSPPLPLPFVILFVKESVAMRHLSLDDLPSTLIRSRNKNLIALNRSYSTEWRFEVKIDFLKVIVIYTILSTKSSGPFLNYLQSIILKKRREKKRKEKTLQLPKTLIQGHFFQPVQFYERSRCTIIHHCLRSLIIQYGVIVQPCNQTA